MQGSRGRASLNEGYSYQVYYGEDESGDFGVHTLDGRYFRDSPPPAQLEVSTTDLSVFAAGSRVSVLQPDNYQPGSRNDYDTNQYRYSGTNEYHLFVTDNYKAPPGSELGIEFLNSGVGYSSGESYSFGSTDGLFVEYAELRATHGSNNYGNERGFNLAKLTYGVGNQQVEGHYKDTGESESYLTLYGFRAFTANDEQEGGQDKIILGLWSGKGGDDLYDLELGGSDLDGSQLTDPNDLYLYTSVVEVNSDTASNMVPEEGDLSLEGLEDIASDIPDISGDEIPPEAPDSPLNDQTEEVQAIISTIPEQPEIRTDDAQALAETVVAYQNYTLDVAVVILDSVNGLLPTPEEVSGLIEQIESLGDGGGVMPPPVDLGDTDFAALAEYIVASEQAFVERGLLVTNDQVDFTRFYVDSVNAVLLESAEEYLAGQEIPTEVTDMLMTENSEVPTLADLMTEMG